MSGLVRSGSAYLHWRVSGISSIRSVRDGPPLLQPLCPQRAAGREPLPTVGSARNIAGTLPAMGIDVSTVEIRNGQPEHELCKSPFLTAG